MTGEIGCRHGGNTMLWPSAEFLISICFEIAVGFFFMFCFKVEAKRGYMHPQPPGYFVPLVSKNRRELLPKEIKANRWQDALKMRGQRRAR